MITLCAGCGELFDADAPIVSDPGGFLCPRCYEAQWTCKECGELAADPDEDPPAKRLTCRECRDIGRADYERDRMKYERAERRHEVKP